MWQFANGTLLLTPTRVAALSSPVQQRLSRRAAVHAAAATLFGAAAQQSAADPPPLNAAELRLQELLRESVAQKEKATGFTFDTDDIAEVEKILRNKYCGKAGLFGAMEGGTCAENAYDMAMYCSKDPRFSSAIGCSVGLPPPPPGQGRLEVNVQMPSLDGLSLPKLPF